MKKTVYSKWLKLTAGILAILCVTLGALTAVGGIVAYGEDNRNIYALEGDFSESWQLSMMLAEPENLVFDAYRATFQQYGTEEDPAVHEESRKALEENLRQWVTSSYYSDQINYYVQWNDLVLTNCNAKTPEELMQDTYFSYIRRIGSGPVQRNSSVSGEPYRGYLLEDIGSFDHTSTIVIACSIKEETVTEYRAIWERQNGIVVNTSVRALVLALTALALLIFLICVCGTDRTGKQQRMWLDSIWFEVHLAAIAGAGVGAIALCAAFLQAYQWGRFPGKLLFWSWGTAAAVGSLLVGNSLLSIVRNLKVHSLMKTSIVFRVLRSGWHLAGKGAKWSVKKLKEGGSTVVKGLSGKTGLFQICLLLVYTALIIFMGTEAEHSAIAILVCVLLFGLGCVFVACRAKDLDEIQKGIGRICDGDLAYRIPEPKSEDMRQLAEKINDIGKGLDQAVSEQVKAEQLKTELITNVSHDLKTPITSIISYAQLLLQVDQLPEEARDYAAVIAKKGDRLKNLTQDLFDISKAQSGNETVMWERLDVALLIHQALGEQDNEIQRSELTFCVDAPKELFIRGDGRKLSRVMSNLIQNILKYTMKNTRVFITAEAKDGMVELVFKNVSAYPLDFRGDEITQRFVRGDQSRTEEGNGLGLAIAKSYTELCGGSLEIVLDGDLFKAILKFEKNPTAE